MGIRGGRELTLRFFGLARKMRTDGQDDAGYNGLTTTSQRMEGVGLVVGGNIVKRIEEKSTLQSNAVRLVDCPWTPRTTLDPPCWSSSYTFRDLRPTYLLSANRFL